MENCIFRIDCNSLHSVVSVSPLPGGCNITHVVISMFIPSSKWIPMDLL